jgi:hypothetical protein
MWLRLRERVGGWKGWATPEVDEVDKDGGAWKSAGRRRQAERRSDVVVEGTSGAGSGMEGCVCAEESVGGSGRSVRFGLCGVSE